MGIIRSLPQNDRRVKYVNIRIIIPHVHSYSIMPTT
jgi:hypothetical protein